MQAVSLLCDGAVRLISGFLTGVKQDRQVNSLCTHRYEKFTGDKPDRPEKSNDPFTDEYTDLVQRINALTLVSSELPCSLQRG